MISRILRSGREGAVVGAVGPLCADLQRLVAHSERRALGLLAGDCAPVVGMICDGWRGQGGLQSRDAFGV